MNGDDDVLDPFLRELVESGIGEAEAMDTLVDALEPAPLPVALRARILASTETEGRFVSFAAQVAKLVDVVTTTAHELLIGIDRKENWVEGPIPVIGLFNFDGGPAVQNAITGFLRMSPGSEFPHHVHVGQETILVLQGRLRESDGSIVGPGETKVSEAGSEHSFEVLDGPELIYLVIVQDGVTIDGELFGPDDPRL